MKKNKTKLGLTLLTTLLLPISVNLVSNNDALAAQGWVKNGNTWYYYNKSGSLERNKWIDGLYWLNSDGKMATNSWVDNNRYYVGANGAWVKDAKRKQGWIKDANSWYYYESNGTLARNKWIDGLYWLNSDGKMATNSWVDNNRYYVGANGAWVKDAKRKQGWVKQANSWYYYESNGTLARNKWVGDYWLGTDGKMATNSWVDNEYYYVDANGKWIPNYRKPIIIHSEVTKADPGNVLVGIKGEFLTPDKDAILRKINRIRKEAFDEGLVQKYEPVKWSTDLEKTALIRATEASISMAHKRLSNKGIGTAFPKSLAIAENLAWEYSGFNGAIQMWYEEKADYIKKEKGLPTSGQTGHYRILINPDYKHIGIASFKNPKNPYRWITTTLNTEIEGYPEAFLGSFENPKKLADSNRNSEKLAGTYGNAIVYTEVSKEKLPYVKKLADIE